MTDLVTTRRGVLATTAAAGVTVLAGCSDGGGGGGGGESAGSSSPAAFESIEIDGNALVVELASDNVSTVNVIGPSGEPSFGSQDVTTGASQVSFAPLTNYQPGEHIVVAVDGEGNEIGRATQPLEPDLELNKILTKSMGTDKDWSPVAFSQEKIEITVANVGNAPVTLSYMIFDRVPTPTPSRLRNAVKNKDHEVGLQYDNLDPVRTISPDETVTGVTPRAVLSMGGEPAVSCGTTAEATITTGFNGREKTVTVPIEYTETGEYGGCSATVTEQP